jgi:hypothetical protein
MVFIFKFNSYTPLVDTSTSPWWRLFRGLHHDEVYHVTRLIDIYVDVFWGFSYLFISLSDLFCLLL